MLIDTERAKKRLIDAGLSKEEASAHLDVLRMVDQQSREALATKADLQELEAALKANMQELETVMKTDMQELEADLKADMQELEADLKADMQELETVMKTDVQELEVALKADMQELETKMYRTAMAAVGFLAALITVLRFV